MNVCFIVIFPNQNLYRSAKYTSVQIALCDPTGCSTPGFPVHHQLLELAQTHVYWVDDANQPSHPLSSPSPPAFNLSQHQGLFQWVSSSHQMVHLHISSKVLELLQLQHQSFRVSKDWFPRGCQVFSNITVQKHQFFGAVFLMVQLTYVVKL